MTKKYVRGMDETKGDPGYNLLDPKPTEDKNAVYILREKRSGLYFGGLSKNHKNIVACPKQGAKPYKNEDAKRVLKILGSSYWELVKV